MEPLDTAASAWVIEPFPGLRPFTAEESELFFGRDEQVKELLRRLANRRFLAVVGTSGSGKSSLVRAGLIPTIERGHLGPTGTAWVIATVSRPGLDPIHGLAMALAGAFGLDPAQIGDIETVLLNSSRGLEDFAQAQLRPTQRLLLLVDQFEELFRYRKQAGPEGRARSTAFVKLLLHATGQSEIVKAAPRGPIYVVLTMRSDYLGSCAQFRGLPETLNDAQYLVPQMSHDQLREAVEGPVALAMAEISDELVDRLLNDVGNDPDMLPVLQHALLRIWEVSKDAREHQRPMAISHYEDPSVGGISQALNLDAEAALAQLEDDPERLRIARRAFQRLVEPGAPDEETRRPTRWSEIVRVCRAPEERVRGVLEVFLRRRFLTLSDDPDPLVDVSHESLIRLWQRLKQWVAEESLSASVYRRLAEDAVRKRALYRGPNLAEARAWRNSEDPNEDWAARYVGDASVFDRAIGFLRRSELRQRLEWGILAAGVLAVVVMAALFYTLYRAADQQKRVAEDQKRVARSRQLAADAQLSRTTQSDRALLLAIEAYRTEPTFEARSVLLAGSESSLGLRAYLYMDSPERIAFSAHGTLLVAANRDGTVKLWDVTKGSSQGEPLRPYKDDAFPLAFSSDGQTVAVSHDGSIQLWNVIARRPIGKPFGLGGDNVRVGAFSGNGKILAIATLDENLWLWDTATGRPLGAPLPGGKSGYDAIAFSPKEGVMALATNKIVRFWDFAGRRFFGAPMTADSLGVEDMAFSADGATLATAGYDGVLKLWDTATGSLLGKMQQSESGAIVSLAFSPDAKLVVSGSWNKKAQLWDVKARRALGKPIEGHTNEVNRVALSPNGQFLATASDDNTIRLWDMGTLFDLRYAPNMPLGIIPPVSLSPDSETLAAAGRDGAVQLIDTRTHLTLRSLRGGYSKIVTSLEFSPDGEVLATDSGENMVRLWDVKTGRLRGSVSPGSSKGLGCVTFSPDGKILVTCENGNPVQLWEVRTQQRLGEPIQASAVDALDFSPDGKTLAILSQDEIRFWDVNSRRPAGRSIGGLSGNFSTLEFSPDGKMLVTGGGLGDLRLWDLATRQPLGEPLRGHRTWITDTAFSPDGKTLASVDGSTLYLWDVATHLPLGDPIELPSSLMNLQFTADSKTLITARVDRTVRRWSLDPDAAIARICSIVNRNLSLSEWQQEIGPDVPYHKTCPDLSAGPGAPQ